MKIKIPSTVLIVLILQACDFSRSVNKDLVTGMLTKGNGLACDDVYLSQNDNKITRTSFVYGEQVDVNFSKITGFKKENGSAFPGLQLLIINQKGDTIMRNDDLYAENVEGFSMSPLLLQTYITIGRPIRSNQSYQLVTNIWDKKEEGNFSAEMTFSVTRNDKIKIESNGLAYNEIYLFSQARNIILTDNTSKLNEDIYMVFEGLDGFQQTDGKISIGLSIKATDANGELVINEEDLIGEAVMNPEEIKPRLAPNFVFTGSDIKSPIACEIAVWDKNGDKRIVASADITLD